MGKKDIIVFGAGNFGKSFVRMMKYHQFRVLFVVDNDNSKWGKELEGTEIRSVDALKDKQFCDVLVVIAMVNYVEAVLQLESLGIKNYTLWSLLFQADLQCKSREILDQYMPDDVDGGAYPNRQVKNDWMNHLVSPYTGRSFEKYYSDTGKWLDVGCGCGKELFHRLCKGYDAWGIDCCEWKMNFLNQKVDDFMFPQEWKERFLFGYGEELSFADESFDVVSCWYVLEHVNDYKKCVQEILRVTKRGGCILLNAPDYRNSWEEHYGIDIEKPLIENRDEFREHLLKIGADMEEYEGLNFIQKSDVLSVLNEYVQSGQGKLEIIDMEKEEPWRRVHIRDNKIICDHRIALVVKKLF